MIPSESEAAFLRFLDSSGLKLKSLRPAKGLHAMLDFYRSIRPAKISPSAHSGDLLMYQWGVFDWGGGPRFELDIRRQFVEEIREDDQGLMSHLSLTFHFLPDGLNALGKGCRLCESLDHLDEFAQFIHDSSPYRELGDSIPAFVQVNWEYV